MAMYKRKGPELNNKWRRFKKEIGRIFQSPFKLGVFGSKMNIKFEKLLDKINEVDI